MDSSHAGDARPLIIVQVLIAENTVLENGDIPEDFFL